jgi:hypothetical protein
VAHAEFLTQLKSVFARRKGHELLGDTGLNAADGAFKFRVRQTEFPENVK